MARKQGAQRLPIRTALPGPIEPWSGERVRAHGLDEALVGVPAARGRVVESAIIVDCRGGAGVGECIQWMRGGKGLRFPWFAVLWGVRV